LKESARHKRGKHIFIAGIATLYAVWLLYAAGLSLLLLSGILYLLGLVIYFYSRYSVKRGNTEKLLND
ncbi:arginine:ornithine antiporter, partial [Escherichia coli]|nr:arginine:ornithine antiporter [Escherichia coli]